MRFLFGIPIAGSSSSSTCRAHLHRGGARPRHASSRRSRKTQMQAMQMSFFFLLPFVFLSGYVFPIDGMPTIFQYLSPDPGQLLHRGRPRHRPARRGARRAVAADRLADLLHGRHHRPRRGALQEDDGVAGVGRGSDTGPPASVERDGPVREGRAWAQRDPKVSLGSYPPTIGRRSRTRRSCRRFGTSRSRARRRSSSSRWRHRRACR